MSTAAMLFAAVPVAHAGVLGWVGPTGVDRASGPDRKAVACPSSTQCTAADAQGQIITFDPGPQAPSPAAIVVDPGQSLNGIACPSTTQCTVADARGGVVTFNPQSPGHPARVQAEVVTFNPAAPVASQPVTIDGGHDLVSIACPTTTLCVVVDDFGGVAEGNPLAAGGWAPGRTLIGSGGVYAVACPLKTRCVAIDEIGNAFSGASDGQPPYPYLLHAPKIVGTALQGQWLNARRGIWSSGALTYGYQWERCNTPDGSCLPISAGRRRCARRHSR